MENSEDFVQELPADNDLFRNPIAAVEEAELNFEEQCAKAAEAVKDADVLLIVTGAGFSADSGLAVYADVARIPAYEKIGLEYHDICQPRVLDDDPEIFYGFWGQCFNDYRSTQPHEGYELMRQWRDRVTQKGTVRQELQKIFEHKVKTERPFDDDETQQSSVFEGHEYETRQYSVFEDHEYVKPVDAFYYFTSNVDAHSYDVFQPEEIYECHGNIELWQCSRHGPDCQSGIWRVPKDHSFDVNTETMRVLCKKTSLSSLPEENLVPSEDQEVDDKPHIGQTKGRPRIGALRNMPAAKNLQGWLCPKDEDGEESNWPVCSHCQTNARPAILMFGDFRWKFDSFQEKRWALWTESLMRLCEVRSDNKEQALKVCIVEVGCGMNVPTCRYTSEDMVERVTAAGGEASLVRINPDFPIVQDAAVEPFSIPIKSRGLRAIRQIHEHLC